MKGRTRTVLGVDIDADRVSLALVAARADGCKVVRAASCPITRDESPSRGIADMTAFSRALRKLRRQARIPRMRAVMGVSVSPLVLQMLDMPKPMPQNVREFVENELGQYVALSGTTIVCDFCAVSSGRDMQRQLLAVAGGIETIRRLTEACARAGLTVEAVEPSILAYARARGRQKEMGACAGKVLIVEVNACQLSACLLCGGGLDFVRTRSAPAKAEPCVTANAWLVDEIDAMMQHCDRESPERDAGWQVDVLVRDGAGVTEEIAESLRARTGVLPRLVAECDDRNRAATAGQDHPLASPIGLGLAMKRLDAPGDAWNVNLLPHGIVQARSLARHVLTIANAAAILFLCMVLSLLFVTRTAHRKRGDLYREEVAQKLHMTPVLATQMHSVDREIAWAQRELDGIKKALDGHRPENWSRLLNAVAESLPADACITRLWSPDATRLCIRGLALSSGTVNGFVQSLNKGGAFASVSLKGVSRPPGGESLVEYEMYCLMEATP